MARYASVWRPAPVALRPDAISPRENAAVSPTTRRTVAALIAGTLVLAPVVTGCGAGKNPESTLPTQLTEGMNVSLHQLDLRNLFVLGPPPGQSIAAGGSAPVYVTMINKSGSPDRLTSIGASGQARSAPIAGGGIDLPPNRPVSTFTASSAHVPATRSGTAQTPATRPTNEQASPTVILRGLTTRLVGGESIRLVLHFQRAGAVTVNAPVQIQQGYYATYSPAPSPSATAPVPPGGRGAGAKPVPSETPTARATDRKARTGTATSPTPAVARRPEPGRHRFPTDVRREEPRSPRDPGVSGGGNVAPEA